MISLIARSHPHDQWRAGLTAPVAAHTIGVGWNANRPVPNFPFADQQPELSDVSQVFAMLKTLPKNGQPVSNQPPNSGFYGLRGRVSASFPVRPWTVVTPSSNANRVTWAVPAVSLATIYSSNPNYPSVRIGFRIGAANVASAFANFPGPSQSTTFGDWFRSRRISEAPLNNDDQLRWEGAQQTGAAGDVQIFRLYIPASVNYSFLDGPTSNLSQSPGYLVFEFPSPVLITSASMAALVTWQSVFNQATVVSMRIPWQGSYTYDNIGTGATNRSFPLLFRSSSLNPAPTLYSAGIYLNPSAPMASFNILNMVVTDSTAVYYYWYGEGGNYFPVTQWNTPNPGYDGPSDAIALRLLSIVSAGFTVETRFSNNLSAIGSGVCYGLLPGDEFILIFHSTMKVPLLASAFPFMTNPVTVVRPRGSSSVAELHESAGISYTPIYDMRSVADVIPAVVPPVSHPIHYDSFASPSDFTK